MLSAIGFILCVLAAAVTGIVLYVVAFLYGISKGWIR